MIMKHKIFTCGSCIFIGPHKIDVTYENVPVPGSPFNVNVVPGNDPNRCRAFGPGLQSCVTNQPAHLTVETKGAGAGGLGLAIEVPKTLYSRIPNVGYSCDIMYGHVFLYFLGSI